MFEVPKTCTIAAARGPVGYVELWSSEGGAQARRH